MAAELHIALADLQFEDVGIQSVESSESGYCVKRTDGWSLFVQNELGFSTPPYPGASLRCWGRGIGYEVRGVGLVVDRRLVGLYRYETAAEREERRTRETAEANERKQKAWSDSALETAERIKRLPETFRERFEFFTAKPGWGPEFGPYELFTCEEAVKIAAHCKTGDDVRRIHESQEAQERIGISDEHSGNTFGSACRLAIVFLEDPAEIPRMHGALCPLVGCGDYGCFAARTVTE